MHARIDDVHLTPRLDKQVELQACRDWYLANGAAYQAAECLEHLALDPVDQDPAQAIELLRQARDEFGAAGAHDRVESLEERIVRTLDRSRRGDTDPHEPVSGGAR